MIPIPVEIGAITLVGWPMLKLGMALASRPLWRKLKALRSALESDQLYGVADHVLIRDVYNLAYGDPAILAAPAFLPALAAIKTYMPGLSDRLGASSAKQHADYKTAVVKHYLDAGFDVTFNGELDRDRRFKALQRLAFSIAFLRYPVATLIALPITGAVIWPAALYREWSSVFRAASNEAVMDFIRLGLARRSGHHLASA